MVDSENLLTGVWIQVIGGGNGAKETMCIGFWQIDRENGGIGAGLVMVWRGDCVIFAGYCVKIKFIASFF
ncbi:hypothetical protein CN378_13085 [Bacillus sp. AFS015802]|nr:hypothetical protein CN378_13085 [Bacillus sp. AFS015802]